MAVHAQPYYLSYLVIVLVVCVSVRALIPRRVLLLGGSGMIGSAVAEQLLDEGHHVTAVNRGNWIWGTDVTIKKRLRFIYCDRNYLQDMCHDLHTSGSYDVVIDFSTYREQQMASILSLLRHRVLQYIYISTDSVYEVSPRPRHEGFSKETDALQPSSTETMLNYDLYGREKLLAEHVLLRETIDVNDSLISNVIILRLPDVIGPRDRTQRWWLYQLWLLTHKTLNHPLHIPAHLDNKKISLVYVADVAELIVSFIPNEGESPRSGIFNLAMKETPTLKELLLEIADCLNIADVGFNEGPLYFYPSVMRGPVDITEAEEILDWQPSRLKHAVCNVCKFYYQAVNKFPEEFDEVVNRLVSLLGQDEGEQESVRKALLSLKNTSSNVEITKKRYKTEL